MTEKRRQPRRAGPPASTPADAAPPARKAARAPRARKPAKEPAAPAAAEAAETEEPAEVSPEVLAAEALRPLEAAEPLQPEVLPPEPVDEDLEDERAADDEGPLVDAAQTLLPVPAGRDLSRADVLQRYMSEVSRHPLLTRDEEHALAVKFRETGDKKAAYRLVTANLRLVVKIAHEYRRAAFSLLDLVQEGNVGLVQAVQKYDPFRGVKLSSYAAWWIRAYILRFLMDNWRMVKLGTTQAQRKLFFNLRKEQERLLAQGVEAGPKLLAERLDVSEQDVREMEQRLSNDEFSLDAPVQSGDESKQTQLDRLAQGGMPADDQLAQEQLRRIFQEKLAAFGKTLTGEKDRFLFERRIAVADGREPLTLQEVGDKFGFSRERARQIEARLTDRLREYLRAELPDFAELSFAGEDPE